jgi:DNA polymerase III subunit beta
MKLTVERETLLPALAAAAPLSNAKTEIPALKHILLTASHGELTVVGNDLDASCSVTIAADVEISGKTAVPTAPFFGLIKRIAKGAQIRMAIDGPLCLVECGRSKYQFPTLLAAGMPAALETQTADAISLTDDDIVTLFERPGIAVCTEESRYYLCGVYLHATDGKLSSCATDGCNLLRFTSTQKFNGSLPVIVPTRFLPLFLKVGAEGGQLAWSHHLISLRADSITLTTKLVQGTFPDYQRVKPPESASYIDVDREELTAACDRLRIVNDSRLVKLGWERDPETLHVSIDHGGNEELRCTSVEMSEGEVWIFPTRTGAVLGALRGEIARLQIHDATSPIRFIDPSEPDVLALTMPGIYGRQAP